MLHHSNPVAQNSLRVHILFMNKIGFVFALVLAGAFFARADDETINLPDLVQGAQQWAQQNLDTNFLNSLPEVDDQKVRQFFRDIQKNFQGEYIVNLAALRQTAQMILPLLQSREDTEPYAAWLAAQ